MAHVADDVKRSMALELVIVLTSSLGVDPSSGRLMVDGGHVVRARLGRAWVLAALTVWIVVSVACARRRSEGADASSARETLVGAMRIPDSLGVVRGVMVTSAVDLSEQRIYARDDGPDVPSRPLAVVSVVTLLAGLRAGLINGETRHVCNGFDCTRVHGELGPADALALSCNHFFAELGGRLGSSALGAAFAALDLEPPPIPEAGEARARLASQSVGWSISPRTALRLARAMATRPRPWYSTLDEGLVLRTPEAGMLRGRLASEEGTAWFVGYGALPETRLIVARVSGCDTQCGAIALRLARWSLERVRALPSAARRVAEPAGATGAAREVLSPTRWP